VSNDPYRLPRTATPRRYDVVLEPDLAAASFTGTVAIALDVHETTDELVGNAVDLTIDEAWVEHADGRRVDAAVSLESSSERFTATTADPLEAGPVTLHLAFRGVLNDKLKGFYRSTFTDDDGTEHVIATTQMQATDCRRAFPSWDEPELKAVFGVTLVVAEEMLAISNGPEVSREPAGPGRVRVTFADTMPMSTYLVAFIVGPLEATPAVDVDGTPLRVVHAPGKAHLTSFAVDIGSFALRWFQEYYGIPYAGQKVDLVALPDFAAGAMENLGCITFRESLLLVDPVTSTQQEEQLVADVVAHELAHMWFGDLVTMKWWNGIWLNEAFATFMEIAACNAFRPAWRRWEQFSLERTAAFETDSLTSTRPVEFEVRSPADADGMFDVLTYQKGGALLRMLEQYLGEERFRDGIRHYLTKHAHGSTETADLWDALEATTGEPVRRIMDTWIWQGGYPLVSVRPSADTQHLVLTQRRFLFDGDDDGTRWAVPVIVSQSHGDLSKEDRLLLDGDEVLVVALDRDATVVVNAGSHGFYRVAYEGGLLERLTGPALTGLSTPERYALVDDAWSAVVAGALDADAFIRFAAGFEAERELPVWQILLNGLRWCGRFVEGADREAFRAFVRRLVEPGLADLGWEQRPEDDELTAELRGTLIRARAVLGDDNATQAEARRRHEQAVADSGSVDPEVAAAALGVVAATGDDDDYDRFVAAFQAAPTPQDQLRYLYALADFPDAAQMERTAELAFSGTVKSQNAPFLLSRAIAHRDHGALAWRHVRERWAEANERFPDNAIVRMVDTVKTLTRPEEQADVAAFFAEHPIRQSTRTLEQILERQRINVALRQRAEGQLRRHFE
jgi:puromycin-sensitive aminopeptidase